MKQKGFGQNNILKTLSGGILTFCSHHGTGICSTEKNLPFIPYSVEPVKSEKLAVPTVKTLNKEVILDACGLQCPGPIMKIKAAIDNLSAGDDLIVYASDPGFVNDIKSWCTQNSHQLIGISGKIPKIEARIKKGNMTDSRNTQALASRETNKTIVVFSGDLDKVLASFVIANGALAMGSKVTMFFTFWGINALRKGKAQASGKGIMDIMFGMMMPRGSKKLGLSRMSMGGIGGKLIRHLMKKKNVASLEELMEQAISNGVTLLACNMSMDLMGIQKEELLDAVVIGGVATFIGITEEADMSFMI